LSVLFSAHKCETIFPGTVVQHRWQVLWSWVNYPWRKPVASSSFPLYPLSLRKHRCMFCVKVHLLRHLLVFYKNNCDEGLCSCVGLSRPIMPSFRRCEKKNQQVRKKKSFLFATKRHREARTQGMLTIWWNLKSCQGPVLNCRGGRKRWVFLFGIPANRAGPDES
jgi:hypothetical protein